MYRVKLPASATNRTGDYRPRVDADSHLDPLTAKLAARHFRNAADAARRTPGGAVVSLEGIYEDEALTDLCERNADALDDAAREELA